MASIDHADGSIDQPPWLGMELRHLAALDALARAGSFRGAAELLGHVQSAVSQQIAHFERVVGMPLVERRHGQRSADLTEAGKALAAHAVSILAQLDAAQADLAPLVGSATQRLRIGIAPSLGPEAGLRLERAIRRLEPCLQVEAVEPVRETALESLTAEGKVDLALGERGSGLEQLASRTLFADPYLLVVPATSAEARKACADLGDLRRLPLLAPSAMQGLAHAETHLRAHGIGVAQVARTAGLATVQALVAQGVGAAVLPSRAVDSRDERIAVLRLDAVLPARPIGLVWHSGRLRAGPTGLICRAVTTDVGDPPAIPRVGGQDEVPLAS